MALCLAQTSEAAEHGYIASLPHAETAEHQFPVTIEKFNGKDPGYGPKHHAHVGTNTVLVSLVFNSAWGEGMSYTQNQVYSRTIELTVEKGRTHYIGARVDTRASADAQRDGSFWEPVVTEVH